MWLRISPHLYEKCLWLKISPELFKRFILWLQISPQLSERFILWLGISALREGYIVTGNLSSERGLCCDWESQLWERFILWLRISALGEVYIVTENLSSMKHLYCDCASQLWERFLLWLRLRGYFVTDNLQGCEFAHWFFEWFTHFLWVIERFACETEQITPIASVFCHERITHAHSFVKSDRSESLKSIFKKEWMSKEEWEQFACGHKKDIKLSNMNFLSDLFIFCK